MGPLAGQRRDVNNLTVTLDETRLKLQPYLEVFFLLQVFLRFGFLSLELGSSQRVTLQIEYENLYIHGEC